VDNTYSNISPGPLETEIRNPHRSRIIVQSVGEKKEVSVLVRYSEIAFGNDLDARKGQNLSSFSKGDA
jgi:hypothetical protein